MKEIAVANFVAGFLSERTQAAYEGKAGAALDRNTLDAVRRVLDDPAVKTAQDARRHIQRLFDLAEAE